MKLHIGMILILSITSLTVSARSEREKKKLELKNACDQAHEEYFVPLRKKYTKECIDKGKNEGWCQRFYSDHGTGIYVYDLPECLELFEYRSNKDS